ncbi:MAG: HAD hydrolase family protein [Bacteroidales bacterium]|nr:HAD hydrolase family protein [Bacteroidales bacterium]
MTDYSRIKAIALDVDGVATDGSLVVYDSHEAVRIFNAKDSFGMRVAAMKGYRLAVFTGGETEGVRFRMQVCGVDPSDVHMGCRGKLREFNSFCEKYGISPKEVLYLGDDIPDIPVLQAAGIGVAPADAAPEAREAADVVAPVAGGKGCVRWAVEQVMRSQGTWQFEPDCYELIF